MEQGGSRIRLRLPAEIPGVIPQAAREPTITLEEMDFFAIAENRKLILEREDHKCFYCLRRLSADNHVIEHVVSRPEGNNSYRNLVAACMQCNNRKGESEAADFLRVLLREGRLTDDEFEQRVLHLTRLRAGELRPLLP